MKLPLLLTVALVFTALGRAAETSPKHLLGAWEINDASVRRVHLTTADYWVQTVYDREQRRFIRTFGGTYEVRGDAASGRIEFDSEDASRVGTTFEVRVTSDGKTLRIIQHDDAQETWTRTDDGTGPLAGVWRITEREVDGKMTKLPLQARRTLKILTGKRFQWVAMNVETGEFSGTGGGTYTLKNGTYVETIDYFSRDASRVGARLSFQADVKHDTWVHRGRSSRGDPVHEVWTRFTSHER